MVEILRGAIGAPLRDDFVSLVRDFGVVFEEGNAYRKDRSRLRWRRPLREPGREAWSHENQQLTGTSVKIDAL